MKERNSDVAEVVRARRFELIADDGVVLATLESGPDGAHFVLRAANGDPRVWLLANEQGSIELTKEAAKESVTKVLGADGLS